MSITSANIKVMTDAARKAGRSLVRDFGEVENLQVSQKGPGDFVTAADLRAEKIIVEELRQARPDYAILTEESGDVTKNPNWQHRYIIDPIDGTNNFMHGHPYFAISIGLERRVENKTEMLAGVIYSPITDELFYAEKGLGAYLGNRRLVVSKRKKLKECLISTGYYWKDDERNRNNMELFKTLCLSSSGIRCAGSAALDLAYVAAGRCDAFWHNGLKSWDIAAGMIIVQEARGMLSEVISNEGMLKSGNIAASNADVHDEFVKHIAEHYKK